MIRDLCSPERLIRTAADPSDLDLCLGICFHYMFFQPFCSFQTCGPDGKGMVRAF